MCVISKTHAGSFCNR